ncbi:Nickel-binding periplasmic protein precursor [Nocardioides dokdonensis FR1436]|uniref:Nickel-binding periplasmic protein n=2 Tax=Nocardioides TaxID=1839 RepID=A0A1A9GHA7_9ACTN|nr:Nickel-binding periplasmic protein precursor [Nocardioides dokdonensis FR1436]
MAGAVIAALTLAACGGGGSADETTGDGGEPTVGGTLRVGAPEDLDALDPHAVRGETGSTWGAMVYETLVGVDQASNPAPGIAESWEVSEDGLTYTFQLDDATFHDGSPVTSEDVVWNYERIAKPESGASQQAFFAQIDEMQTPDEKTLVIDLAAPNAAFLSVLGIQGRAGIQSPDNFDGDEMVAHIGSGPFTWESYTPNNRLILARYADYWGEPAYIEEVELRILPDDNARLQALSSGELDLAFGLDSAQAEASAASGAFELQTDSQNRGNFFAINTTKAPFDNVDVRRAMQLAVSREDIAAAGWGGFAEPTNQPFDAESPWFVESDYPVTADLDEAKRLIQEAGAEGTEVEVLVWDALGSEQEAQIVASAWTEIGLEPKLTKVDITTIVTDSSAGDFDVIYLWIGLITDPTRPYAYLAQDNANNGLAGLLKDDELTDKVKQAASENDEETRKELYAEILEENYAQAAQYYTVNPTIFVGVGNNLQGYEQGTYNVIYHEGGLSKAFLKDG